MNHFPVIIAGAGPAGLGAAYELVRNGIRPLVLEKTKHTGGIARTECYQGYRFDIGGHRFFTKIDRVSRLWQEVLGDGLITVPRHSHIYYQGKYFHYPMEIFDALIKLGIGESLRVLASYTKAKVLPIPDAQSFDQWVTNHFGKRLFEIFFKDYTEKVWGIPCSQISAEWAAQRIRGLSLPVAIKNAIFSRNRPKTLIKEFTYPVYGPGMMWEAFCRAIVAGGGVFQPQSKVIEVRHQGSRFHSVLVRQGGDLTEIRGDSFISSLPLGELILALNPSAPARVAEAARQLQHRAFLMVGLILNQAGLFPDNWIYINSGEVQVGRIQNFGNWSRAMVPDPSTSSLGLEYFCNEEDETWRKSDPELVLQAWSELQKLGLAGKSKLLDGVVFRQSKAYPIYQGDYRNQIQLTQEYLATFENLQSIGRNGMHRYNNMDHSLLSGLLAAENVLGARHDCWEVNRQQDYHESLETTAKGK
jgi:protoporphyrinogen oxidase